MIACTDHIYLLWGQATLVVHNHPAMECASTNTTREAAVAGRLA